MTAPIHYATTYCSQHHGLRVVDEARWDNIGVPNAAAVEATVRLACGHLKRLVTTPAILALFPRSGA